MLRTGLHNMPINTGKRIALMSVLQAYRSTAVAIGRAQWHLLHTNGKLDRNAHTAIATALSARYVQTCRYQVVGALEGFLGNCQNAFKEYVLHSSLDETARIALLYINKYKAWYKKSVTMQGVVLGADVMRFARNIMRAVLSRHRRPRLGRCNLALDEKVATVEASRRAHGAGYWIRLSTMVKGKPIYLPVAHNPWFESLPGQTKAFCQINLRDDGALMAGLIKEVGAAPYRPKTALLGIDVGLRVLVATSEGDLFGQGVLDKLVRMDQGITALARHRQRSGLRVRSRRYDRLVNRMRAYLKNEIHRTLRSAILRHCPAEICVEQLDFRSPRMSRRMNRLVQNFGRSVFNEALEKYASEYGFTVTKVEPAYSSKKCSRCDYVDDRNRDGDVFRCLHCGLKRHADVNAARNHKQYRAGRSGDKGVAGRRTLAIVLQELVDRFATQERLAVLRRKVLADPTLLAPQRRHSSPGLCMLGNPYFATTLRPILAAVARTAQPISG